MHKIRPMWLLMLLEWEPLSFLLNLHFCGSLGDSYHLGIKGGNLFYRRVNQRTVEQDGKSWLSNVIPAPLALARWDVDTCSAQL